MTTGKSGKIRATLKFVKNIQHQNFSSSKILMWQNGHSMSCGASGAACKNQCTFKKANMQITNKQGWTFDSTMAFRPKDTSSKTAWGKFVWTHFFERTGLV